MKPLPRPPEGSRLPSNQTQNSATDADVYDRENRVGAENGTNSGQASYNGAGGGRRHSQDLQSENESLRRRIQQLEEAQRNLAEENCLLRQVRDTPSPSFTPVPRSSGCNTPTPCAPHGDTSGQANSKNDASHDPSQRDSPPQSTANEQGSTPSTRGTLDQKVAARMQLSRVIERAQASSPDAVDPKKLSQPIAKSVTQTPPPESVRSSLTSPLSPLSPAASTPSPTALVTFGLASQAKRNAIKRPTGRGNARESKSSTPTSVSSEAVSERKSESPDGSVTEKGERESQTTTQGLRPGQFAGKSSKSIVSATAKLFQPGDDTDTSGAAAAHNQGSSQEPFDTNTLPGDLSSDRGKESLSSESDEVFTSSNSRPTEPPETSEETARWKQGGGWQREAKSESQILQRSQGKGGGEKKKRGVISKRNQLKSDVSWIKNKGNAARDEDTPNRSESPSQSQASPPLRPYRSHQILNSPSSSPTPPSPSPSLSSSSSTKPPMPSSQLTRPGLTLSSKPSHHRSHNVVTEEIRGAGEGKRGRGSSISEKARFKLKGRKKSEEERKLSRSMSDESLHGTVQRGVQAYSSQRKEVCVCLWG